MMVGTPQQVIAQMAEQENVLQYTAEIERQQEAQRAREWQEHQEQLQRYISV